MPPLSTITLSFTTRESRGENIVEIVDDLMSGPQTNAAAGSVSEFVDDALARPLARTKTSLWRAIMVLQ